MDKEQGIIHVHKVKDLTVNERVILDTSIDFYSLGVYIRLKYLIEHNLNQDKLCELGNISYIEKALEKLRKGKYIEEIN